MKPRVFFSWVYGGSWAVEFHDWPLPYTRFFPTWETALEAALGVAR